MATRETWRERMDVYRAQGAEIEEPDWEALRGGRDLAAEEEDEFERFKAEYEANKHSSAFQAGKPGDGGTVAYAMPE